MAREKEDFITVQQGIGGYFAVLMVEGEFGPEPWQTGIGRYAHREDAVAEAQSWAYAEDVRCEA